MKRADLKRLPREPLTADDLRLLQARFRQRLRSFIGVALVLVVLVLIEAGPETAKIHAAIGNPKLRWAILSIAFALAAAVFYRRVWVYRRDHRAGFRYVDHMLIIGRNPPGTAGRLTIDLEDLRYHNLEVSREIYDRLQPGDRYPVGFAAHSGYPLTLAGKAAGPVSS